jgi:CRP/FNR family transcriptional regulator
LAVERSDLGEALQRTALFASLSPSEVQLLAARTARKVFRSGEVLFHEGDACRGLHIIARGRIRIFKSSASGREQVLAVNVPGETIAEVPVFDGGPYPASAIALEETEIAFVSRKDFQDYCLDHPEVALKMLAFVGARLRGLVGIIEELSFTTIRQRLVALLVRLAQHEGKKAAGGIELMLPGSHQEMANQLGTVRELVSRNLMRLQAEGLVEVDGRQIVIRDLKGLAALLE